MNLNVLSDDELLNYLDKHNTDPIMKRVVDVLLDKQHGIISDLVAAGMDPQDWTFCSDSYNHFYPGQYVTHLKNEIDSVESDLESVQYELEDAKKEIKRLKARGVAELISELHDTIQRSDAERDHARQERDRAIINERSTKDKMKVWTALSTDVSR